jgi:UDP-N-acetylglucosamine:LPS N-acetylglucosamine transferase
VAKQKEKYLFLYLRTGGGHIAPAKSIASYIGKHFPEQVDVLLVDGFEKTKKYARAAIEGGYRRLQMHARWWYEFLYLINKIPLVARWNNAIVSYYTKAFLTELLLRERPEKIVIFHFFLIKPVYDILREHGISIPVITVVTDPFTAHPIWFLQKKQTYVVFSEELKVHCIARGIDSACVHVFPFVLDEKFSNPINDNAIPAMKRSMGFSSDDKLILIMGGGDGIPKGATILKHLIRSQVDAQIVIVCGKNALLFRKSTCIKEKHNVNVLTVFGYVDTMYELINISDVVITKCGASAFMEIILSKKIPIVTTYLWEQEKGNMEFIRTNRLGVYEPSISKLPDIIKTILNDPQTRKSYHESIAKLSLKNGTESVSRFIVDFA